MEQLKYNNKFGNKNRFTDENGEQIYPTGQILDHLYGQMKTFTGKVDEEIKKLSITNYPGWVPPSPYELINFLWPLKPFKAFIRVVKSIRTTHPLMDDFKSINVVKEPLIFAENKQKVLKILTEQYPQFFPEKKIYQKETKDKAQFFYVIVYPLQNYELELLNSGKWKCDSCGQVHENKYISRPRTYKLFPNKLFCSSEDDICLEKARKERYRKDELMDDEAFIRIDSNTFIYKITEKATGKCYIGKTRNEPFFRWWNHYTKSTSPFGLYLQKTKISDWTFEVIDILPHNTSDKEVFKKESEYIIEFNSIDNGFNTVISNSENLKPTENPNQVNLF